LEEESGFGPPSRRNGSFAEIRALLNAFVEVIDTDKYPP